jgi:histidine ammonia-lyase
VAVEWLCAAQGVDLRAPLRTSAHLQQAQRLLRDAVPMMAEDRYLAPDLAAAKRMVQDGALRALLHRSLLG